MPKVAEVLCSVVIPAYNVEAYVGEAIRSALAQTLRPLEIVVVNDGSTDDTARITKSFESDGIVYVEQENRGLAAARNSGIRAASGDFIALLDGDDVWMPERLERCLALLNEHREFGWVTSDSLLLSGATPTEKRYYGDIAPTGFPATHGEQLRCIARGNFIFVAAVIRRELFERHGLFDEQLRRAEDYDLWIRFLLGGATVGRVDAALGWYRLRPDSLSANAAAQWSAHLDVLERHLPALGRQGAPGAARECYDIARRLAARGQRRRACEFAVMALRAPDSHGAARARLAASLARAIVEGSRAAR